MGAQCNVSKPFARFTSLNTPSTSQSSYLDVDAADPLELRVQPHVLDARRQQRVYVNLARRAKARILAVLLQALDRARVAWFHLQTELQRHNTSCPGTDLPAAASEGLYCLGTCPRAPSHAMAWNNLYISGLSLRTIRRVNQTLGAVELAEDRHGFAETERAWYDVQDWMESWSPDTHWTQAHRLFVLVAVAEQLGLQADVLSVVDLRAEELLLAPDGQRRALPDEARLDAPLLRVRVRAQSLCVALRQTKAASET